MVLQQSDAAPSTTPAGTAGSQETTPQSASKLAFAGIPPGSFAPRHRQKRMRQGGGLVFTGVVRASIPAKPLGDVSGMEHQSTVAARPASPGRSALARRG